MTEKNRENRARDVATLRVLGIFFAVMGALVLVAVYGTIGNTPAMIVNFLSGLALGTVGIGMILISQRMNAN